MSTLEHIKESVSAFLADPRCISKACGMHVAIFCYHGTGMHGWHFTRPPGHPSAYAEGGTYRISSGDLIDVVEIINPLTVKR
jgi:hypothetical protein